MPTGLDDALFSTVNADLSRSCLVLLNVGKIWAYQLECFHDFTNEDV